ncbi:MAG: ABC transporter permease [Planctomycetaceae bacterium]|nr:ABC transporter permease [Planctomycetaceae bacterium]
MNMFSIAWKSVRQRRVATSLTALSIALGVMLMVIVLIISGAIQSAFNQRSTGYDLIVGPKGSDLQLVLSSVYRIQPPIENLPYMYLEQLRNDRRVESAVPLAFGDVTEEGSYPIVGTTSEYFENQYAPGKSFRIRGKRMNGLFDSIIGAEVARMNSWDIGSQFTIKHGGAESDHVHDEKFTVVAVIAPTGTADDKSVFLNLEGFYAIAGHSKPVGEVRKRLQDFYAAEPEMLKKSMAQLDSFQAHLDADAEGGHDHDHHHHHETPDAMKEVTSILVRTQSGNSAFPAMSLISDLKTGYQAMAVNPVIPIQRLMKDVLGNIQKALILLTAVIVVVSGVSICVSIYNSMSDRRKEIGVMRALGASRTTLSCIIIAESTLLCVGGGLIGWLLGHGIAALASPAVSQRTGLLLNRWAINPWEIVLFPALLLLAILVGFLPAISAYKTDVAEALSS